MKNQLLDPLERYSQTNSLIFLLRHGKIQGSEEKRYIGTTDVCLDNQGVLQAHYWEKVFSPLKIKTIYSSSLKRCSHTAQLIANGKKIITCTPLNEINMGSWDGKTFDQIKTEHPKEFEKRGNTMDIFKPPQGESFYDVSCRVLPFFNRNINRMENNQLIVTHAGVIRVILSYILNRNLKDLLQIEIAYGELFVIDCCTTRIWDARS